MPKIDKSEKIIERTQVLTQQGEVTINLNLTIKVENGEISVKTSSEEQKENKFDSKLAVPEEQFDLELPILQNFGKKE